MSLFERLETLDQELMLYLSEINSPFFDDLFPVVTNKFTWIPLYAFFAYLLYRKHGWKGLGWGLVAIAILVLATDQLTNLAKTTVGRARPCHNLLIQDLVNNEPLGKCGGYNSWFSGHSSNSFAIATFMGIFLGKRKWLWLLWLWAGLVAYSRVYLGVHYPFDIFCGMLAGMALGFTVAKLYLGLRPRLPWWGAQNT